MNPLLKEIEEEMKRTRLDKTRLYGILAKIVESCPHVPAAAPAPAPTPAPAPAPTPAPAPAKAATPAKKPAAKPAAKKTDA